MSITIEVAPNAEKVLRKEARRRGLSVPDYAKTIIEEHLPPQTEETEETLAEALAEFIGVVRSDGTERFSENSGDKFADYLIEKHRRGHL
jgi:hypothetical protein